ncbi:MAG TPA: choice-of-anchor B family protein [Fimbriimonas sp.]
MKRLLLAGILGLAGIAGAQYPARSVRFLNQIDLPTLGARSGSGCSGYVSPSGREYAIIGLNTGYTVVDITRPTAPRVIGHLPGVDSLWHEVAVIGDYAYGVTEGGGGMQVIDLRGADLGSVVPRANYTGNDYGRGHTIQASPNTPTLYIHGAQPAPGGIIALNVSNPEFPVEIGRWGGAYVHDAQYVFYESGPYAGREIAFACCGAEGLYILDVSNKANIVVLGSLKYLANGGYCHSGSLTPDGRFFLVNDEFDESNGLFPTATTHVIDVQNLSAPAYVRAFTNGVQAIDHNSMVQDGHLMLASYTAGLRVYRIGGGGALRETGFLDTFPSGDVFDYAGDWGVFAGFPSGNVIVSDMNRGLFVLDPSEAKGMGAPIVKVVKASGALGESANAKLRRAGYGVVPFTGKDWQPGLRVLFDSNETAWTRWNLAVRLGSSDGTTGKVRAYLKDHGSGAFKKAGEWSYGPTRQTFSVSSTDASVVDASGNLELKLVVSAGAGVATSVDVDMTRVTLR